MKPIAVNSLFRWINFLFGAKKFRVPDRTGNLPQRIGIAERIDVKIAERGPKWPEFEGFPVIFPVSRELEVEGLSCLRGSPDPIRVSETPVSRRISIERDHGWPAFRHFAQRRAEAALRVRVLPAVQARVGPAGTTPPAWISLQRAPGTTRFH
jgi:hypothetical protein